MREKKLETILEKITKDRTLRIAITRNSHFWFFHCYFHHYVKYPTAEFQKEIIRLTEDEKIRNLFIVAFRGSSKSSLITLSYVLWAILGIQKKKCVIIASQTARQAQMHLLNIKRELESNKMLRDDLGPFKEENSPWGMAMLVFPQYNAMIIPLSTEQAVRGNRFGQDRPDLIVGDDLENDTSVRTQESRDKTYDWLKNEVIPAGDRDTRLVIVGNLLHEDSLLMRLKRETENGELENSIFRKYPIIEDGKILWPGKFPDMQDIENERKRIGNAYSWGKEFLLEILSRDGQIIAPEWIEKYDSLPEDKRCYRGIFVGVDPAVAQNNRSDFTAMVAGLLCEINGQYFLYVLQNPVNRKMVFKEILDQIQELNHTLRLIYEYVFFAIEGNSAQAYIAQALEPFDIVFKTVQSRTDKHSRLFTVSHLIQNKNILFPEQGAEHLIRQIVHFGIEQHDDLVDAFTMMTHEAVTEIQRPKPQIDFIQL